jgi:hypothetical protein
MTCNIKNGALETFASDAKFPHVLTFEILGVLFSETENFRKNFGFDPLDLSCAFELINSPKLFLPFLSPSYLFILRRLRRRVE